MVENIEQENALKHTNSKSYKKVGFLFTLLAVCGAGAYFWYQNPGLLGNFAAKDKESAIIQNLQNQINALNLKVQNLEAATANQIGVEDLAMLNDKVNGSLRFNDQVLSAKADVNSVLGVINRVDNLELKVRNLGQISSQGALVLTASMLVKDSAYKGPFIYEAEVLRHLAYGTSMQSAAEEIYHLSANKVLCAKKLTEAFNVLYANKNESSVVETEKETPSQEDATNWKDKIASKLNELVIIEKHEDKTKSQEEMPKDEVYKLVNEGYFSLAIEKMKQNEAYNTEGFKIWVAEVLKREHFEHSLKQIEALTLAFMKAENLQNAQ